MTPEVLAALRRIVDEIGADGGVLVRLSPTGAAVVTASTLVPGVVVGDEWGVPGTLAVPDDQPELAVRPERLADLVPAAARLALATPLTAALVAPLPDTRSLIVLLWARSALPSDVVGALESGSFHRFTLLAPLLEAQVQAQEAASRLKSVVVALEQAVVLTATGSGRVDANAAAVRLLGLAGGTVTSEELSDALLRLRERALDRSALDAEADRLLDSPAAVVRDWVWVLRGTPSHLRVTTVPVRTITGGGRIWVFDDISSETELVASERRAARALADSEQRYRLLAENVSDVVMLERADGTLTWISPSVEITLGWAPEDVLGRRIGEFVHPSHLAEFAARRDRLLLGERAEAEVPFRTAAGDYRWVLIRGQPLLDADGDLVGRVAALWDVQDVQDAHDAREELERSERRAAETLAESEHRYRILAENVSDVVVQGSAPGPIDWVSPSVTNAVGWTPEDLVGTSFFDLVHPADRSVVAAAQPALERGEQATFEVRVRTASGDHRWMSIRVKPVLDDEGRFVGRVAAWWDHQAAHEAMEQLERSETRYRLLLENTSEVVFQTVDGLVTWLSPASEEVTGWPSEDVVGSTSEHLWHPDDWKRISDLHDGAREGAHGREVLRLRTPDGSYRWMEIVIRPYREADGRPATVGMMYDVSDRVAAQEAAWASEERYRVVAENASDVVCRYRPDGTIEWIFGSTETFLGRSAKEMVGTSLIDHFVAEDWGDRDDIRERLARGEAVQLLSRLRHADGSTRWVELRAQAVVGADGSLESLIGTMRDAQAEVDYREALAASERQARDLVDAYEAARDEAIRSSTAKTAFLSRMSHELRTPLNAVLGFAQLLSLDPLTSEQADAVQHIRTGGRHLLDLINEIVDISRIEAGRLTLTMGAVDAVAVLADAAELVRELARQNGIVVLPAATTARVPDVRADRQRLTQVLLNLLSNAVKYNRPSGSVQFGCRTGAPGEVVFEVTDTGPGIPEALLPRLFEPFDRLGAERSDVEGTGIGLALADALARAMGGRIEVVTELGTGSTFSLVLRAAPAVSMSGAPAGEEPDAKGDARLHILYIEDNPTNATLMGRVVALRPGSRLQVAVDGIHGLGAALHEPPDLVFLDLHLPDLSGEEVLKRLRRLPGCADVPVVVVTADASPRARERMSALGSDGFLTKPFELDDVLGWIDATATARDATASDQDVAAAEPGAR